MAILDVLQFEKQSMFDQNEMLETRLQVERGKLMEKQQQLSQQKIKYGRLEKKYGKLRYLFVYFRIQY